VLIGAKAFRMRGSGVSGSAYSRNETVCSVTSSEEMGVCMMMKVFPSEALASRKRRCVLLYVYDALRLMRAFSS